MAQFENITERIINNQKNAAPQHPDVTPDEGPPTEVPPTEVPYTGYPVQEATPLPHWAAQAAQQAYVEGTGRLESTNEYNVTDAYITVPTPDNLHEIVISPELYETIKDNADALWGIAISQGVVPKHDVDTNFTELLNKFYDSSIGTWRRVSQASAEMFTSEANWFFGQTHGMPGFIEHDNRLHAPSGLEIAFPELFETGDLSELFDIKGAVNNLVDYREKREALFPIEKMLGEIFLDPTNLLGFGLFKAAGVPILSQVDRLVDMLSFLPYKAFTVSMEKLSGLSVAAIAKGNKATAMRSFDNIFSPEELVGAHPGLVQEKIENIIAKTVSGENLTIDEMGVFMAISEVGQLNPSTFDHFLGQLYQHGNPRQAGK